MKTLAISIFCFISFISSAQLLKRDTKVYNKIDGDELYMLKDSTSVSLDNIENSWYKSKVVVLVERTMWSESDSTINAGAIIYDADKNEIGKTSQDFKALDSRIEDVRKYRKMVWVQLEGYVYNKNVHYYSIPEKGIERIVNGKNRGGLQEIYKEYFDTYSFKKVETSDYTYWVYLDKNASIEEEKPYRLIVIFRGETSVMAIVTNNRPFDLVKLKLKKDESSGIYYFTSKPNDKAFEAIEDQVYSFIPL